MERDRECRLLLNDLNDILSEQCLEQRVRCRYLNDPVQELAECINQLLDICERAVTMTLDIENDYRTMRAELQSNIRNPLSCIKNKLLSNQFTCRKKISSLKSSKSIFKL